MIDAVYNQKKRHEHVLAVEPPKPAAGEPGSESAAPSTMEAMDGQGQGKQDGISSISLSMNTIDNPPDNLRDILVADEYRLVEGAVQLCAQHSRFPEYIQYIMTLGVEDDWSFGSEDASDPLEDVIHFTQWLQGSLSNQHSPMTKQPTAMTNTIDYECIPHDIEDILRTDAGADIPQYDLSAELQRIKKFPMFQDYMKWGVSNNEFDDAYDIAGDEEDPVDNVMHFINWLWTHPQSEATHAMSVDLTTSELPHTLEPPEPNHQAEQPAAASGTA